jgi:hypothetical protein
MFRGFTTKEYDVVINAIRIIGRHLVPWIYRLSFMFILASAIIVWLVLIGVIRIGN